MKAYSVVRSSCGVPVARRIATGHRPFSLGFLDVPLRVRLRRFRLRAAAAGFGLARLATAFLNNPGYALP
jgi:hypothetical protein